jgi:hypothetical protein
VDVPRILTSSDCKNRQQELNRTNHTFADWLLAIHQVSSDLSQALICESSNALYFILLILFEPNRIPWNSLHLLTKTVQLSNRLDFLNLHALDLGDMFRKVPLVDGLDVGPIILNC